MFILMRKTLLPFLVLITATSPFFAQKPELFIPWLKPDPEATIHTVVSPNGQLIAQMMGTPAPRSLTGSGPLEIWIWRTNPLRPIRRVAAPDALISSLAEIPDISGLYWFSPDSKALFIECASGILKVLIDEGREIIIRSRSGDMFSRLAEKFLSKDGRFCLKYGNPGGWIMNSVMPNEFRLELFDLEQEKSVLDLLGSPAGDIDDEKLYFGDWYYIPRQLGLSSGNDTFYFHPSAELDMELSLQEWGEGGNYEYQPDKLALNDPDNGLPVRIFEGDEIAPFLSERFDLWQRMEATTGNPYGLALSAEGLKESDPDLTSPILFSLPSKTQGQASDSYECYCQEIGTIAEFDQGKKLLLSLRPCISAPADTILKVHKVLLFDLQQNWLKTVIDSSFFTERVELFDQDIYFERGWESGFAKVGLEQVRKTSKPLSIADLSSPGTEIKDNPLFAPRFISWPSTTRVDAPDGSFQLAFINNYNNSVVIKDNKANKSTKIHKGMATVDQAKASSDSRFVYLCTDGRIDIWDARSQTFIAQIIFLDAESWVAITPSGLFDASPHAMNKLYYAVGQETIELEQLKERYYEPGLLPKLLGFSDDPIRSVSRLETVPLYPEVEAEIRQDSLYIQLRARSGGIGKVSLFINDKEILEEANPERRPSGSRDSSIRIGLEDFGRYFYAHPDSTNRITIRAYNQAGWLKSSPFELTYTPNIRRAKGEGEPSGFAPSFDAVNDPALYAIIIGTADYSGNQLDLKYSGKDATAMAQAVQQSGGQLFGMDAVFVQLLTTDTADIAMHPTKANILDAFKAFEKQTRAEDILLVYLSGHGITYGDADRAQFYYLTQEMANQDLSDDGIRLSRAVSSSELTRWINLIPAQKQVLIIDACNSGKLVESLSAGQKALSSSQVRALDRMQDRTGMFVIAGSASDKVSYEASKYGQGLLTYSLLQGVDGLALREGQYVDVARLFEFAQKQVPLLAEDIGGIQQPMADGPIKGSFDIGINNEAVNIHLSSPKPVFVRNYFQDELLFDDVLEIGKLLEEHFQQLSAKGMGAQLIYVDIPEYTKAYSLKGRYQRKGDKVRVYGKLFKGKEARKDFDVSIGKNALQELPEAILRQVEGAIE